MRIGLTAIEGVFTLEPKKHGDARGFFSEVFRADVLADRGVDLSWTQDNHAYSAAGGVVRGLHFQSPPHAQAKLIRVTRGSIYDVAVDIRQGSPTYGQHVAVELSDRNWMQLFVPAGFAHGYCTLEPHTEVLYKVSGQYSPEAEGGLRWDDPDIAIKWPLVASDAVVSPKDAAWPTFRDLLSPFIVATA